MLYLKDRNCNVLNTQEDETVAEIAWRSGRESKVRVGGRECVRVGTKKKRGGGGEREGERRVIMLKNTGIM